MHHSAKMIPGDMSYKCALFNYAMHYGAHMNLPQRMVQLLLHPLSSVAPKKRVKYLLDVTFKVFEHSRFYSLVPTLYASPAFHGLFTVFKGDKELQHDLAKLWKAILDSRITSESDGFHLLLYHVWIQWIERDFVEEILKSAPQVLPQFIESTSKSKSGQSVAEAFLKDEKQFPYTAAYWSLLPGNRVDGHEKSLHCLYEQIPHFAKLVDWSEDSALHYLLQRFNESFKIKEFNDRFKFGDWAFLNVVNSESGIVFFAQLVSWRLNRFVGYILASGTTLHKRNSETATQWLSSIDSETMSSLLSEFIVRDDAAASASKPVIEIEASFIKRVFLLWIGNSKAAREVEQFLRDGKITHKSSAMDSATSVALFKRLKRLETRFALMHNFASLRDDAPDTIVAEFLSLLRSCIRSVSENEFLPVVGSQNKLFNGPRESVPALLRQVLIEFSKKPLYLNLVFDLKLYGCIAEMLDVKRELWPLWLQSLDAKTMKQWMSTWQKPGSDVVLFSGKKLVDDLTKKLIGKLLVPRVPVFYKNWFSSSQTNSVSIIPEWITSFNHCEPRMQRLQRVAEVKAETKLRREIITLFIECQLQSADENQLDDKKELTSDVVFKSLSASSKCVEKAFELQLPLCRERFLKEPSVDVGKVISRAVDWLNDGLQNETQKQLFTNTVIANLAHPRKVIQASRDKAYYNVVECVCGHNELAASTMMEGIVTHDLSTSKEMVQHFIMTKPFGNSASERRISAYLLGLISIAHIDVVYPDVMIQWIQHLLNYRPASTSLLQKVSMRLNVDEFVVKHLGVREPDGDFKFSREVVALRRIDSFEERLNEEQITKLPSRRWVPLSVQQICVVALLVPITMFVLKKMFSQKRPRDVTEHEETELDEADPHGNESLTDNHIDEAPMWYMECIGAASLVAFLLLLALKRRPKLMVQHDDEAEFSLHVAGTNENVDDTGSIATDIFSKYDICETPKKEDLTPEGIREHARRWGERRRREMFSDENVATESAIHSGDGLAQDIHAAAEDEAFYESSGCQVKPPKHIVPEMPMSWTNATSLEEEVRKRKMRIEAQRSRRRNELRTLLNQEILKQNRFANANPAQRR